MLCTSQPMITAYAFVRGSDGGTSPNSDRWAASTPRAQRTLKVSEILAEQDAVGSNNSGRRSAKQLKQQQRQAQAQQQTGIMHFLNATPKS